MMESINTVSPVEKFIRNLLEHSVSEFEDVAI